LFVCFDIIIAVVVLYRNVVFYYSSGITIGVLASLLIIVFLVSRFIPKKVGAYSVLVGGSSVVVYFFRFLWENISSVLQAYMIYVAAYVAIAATVSFAVCYRKGPVTDARSLDLIQWAMQAVALAAVYYGTQVDEVSVGIVLAVIAMRVLPAVPCGGFVTKAWQRRFPPKPRLLTEEEYQQQGEEETRRALEELRRYCQSPACSPWKTVGQLKTPSKFASFIEGDAHVSSSEEEEYYRDVTAELDLDLSFTEDEDD
ncbi:PREDICTED: nuclear envelope integral membrane protein 1-like, partial [Priapulus caudatus]|uniref:Nuclear envelope integral membrane protein 1-like n=1 Tax=Priapulus caudatus TaxID=37621 RepID=A0ABM1EFF3_PRICU